jgi:acetyl esterase/lipase
MNNRRALLKMGGGAVVAAAWGTNGLCLAAEPHSDPIDVLNLVDPELRAAALQIQQDTARYPMLSAEWLPKLRTMVGSMSAPPLDSVPFAEKWVTGSKGNPDVRMYVVNAKAGSSRPGIVHLHGGGFVFGDAKSTVRELQELSAVLDCCAVAIDYRLAPETRYQGSVEDNYAGLLWMFTHAAELGVDPARIAVMGESAGGGHAALLAIVARDRDEVPVALQVLIYPMLDDRTGSSRQMPAHIGTIGWSAQANRFGWASFLGQQPGSRRVPSDAVPARVTNLRGLPPAFIGVGSVDLFVSEDIDYAQRLINAGVPTELHVVSGAYHGFDHNLTASVSKQFNAAKLGALRRAFGISLTP